MPYRTIYYKGLYGSDTIEFIRSLIHVYPFGKIGRENKGKVKSHAHSDLFQIFLIEKGTTILEHEQVEYKIDKPSLVTIPKNVPHGFTHLDDVDGWIITLSDTMMEFMLQTEADIIHELDVINITEINEENPKLTRLTSLVHQCVDEYENEKAGKRLMLYFLVGQLLIALYRLPIDNQKVLSTDSNQSNKIYYRRFLQLIKSGNTYKTSINEYANLLGISSGYLNRVCNEVANKPPKDIISDYFMTQARAALSNIENTVVDVSYQIGIEDPSYFSRLFKKKTGLTPLEFRKKINIKG